ncbi:hypothetical protein POPTR_008G131750v4 [Populus trichocarpa]|uniref:Uncharacterized protein n=1 Tax=Populus trichocarpa TaxID=3694 RepID=A0ACC0SLG1_POPTR|nr:hypothetical protein BDE02_08G119400 [Populus trichocarpa]KAI9390062.1 hypothetical protein POPTR_008G131750v4 [Populus trichocarpa]
MSLHVPGTLWDFSKRVYTLQALHSYPHGVFL